MNNGPVTNPTILQVMAPAWSHTTCLSPTLLASIITGMLIPELNTAKLT